MGSGVKMRETAYLTNLLKLNRIAGIRDKSLTKAVLPFTDEIDDAPDRGLCQQGLLVQVDDPIIVAQHVHVFLCNRVSINIGTSRILVNLTTSPHDTPHFDVLY